MSASVHARCRALIAVLAVALASAAPATAAPGYPPPNHPSAVPAAPGALTHARTPSDVEAARAVERYYSSYDVDPLPAAPAVADAGDGIGALPFVVSLSGALVIGLAAGSALPALLARRRRVGIAS